MQRLTSSQIREKFSNASTPTGSLYEKALGSLSAALADLQKEGIDVELMVTGVSAEQVFKLSIGDYKSWWQRSCGILRIGNSHHLVGFIVQTQKDADSKKKNCATMVMSQMDIRWQGTREEIRPLVYNLHQNGNDLITLQEFIITTAASQKIVEAMDTYKSFQGTKRLIEERLVQGLPHQPAADAAKKRQLA